MSPPTTFHPTDTDAAKHCEERFDALMNLKNVAHPRTTRRELREKRVVQVLHKRTEINSDAPLAIGQTFKFKSGSRYSVTASGAVINPDRFHGSKKERMAQRQARQALRS